MFIITYCLGGTLMEKLHPELIILSLIDLYTSLTNEDTIDLESLQKAFKILEAIINNNEDIMTNFNFSATLTKFTTKYANYFDLDDFYLTITSDLDIIYDLILSELTPSYLDDCIEEYMHNIAIYEALEIPIPLNETKQIFTLNREIMHTYNLIAEQEYQNNPKMIFVLLFRLQHLITNFENEFQEIDEEYLTKLKMCLAKHNECLVEDDTYFTNTGWHIALFSKNPLQMQKLCYERIEYLTSKLDVEMHTYKDLFIDDEEDEEVAVASIHFEDPTPNEEELFLNYYLSYLNSYLHNPLPDNLRAQLLAKKYLLLAMPELHHSETYFLTHGTLDNLELPSINPEYLSNSSFDLFYLEAFTCALSLDYTNDDIKDHQSIYLDMILRALFIKCYLDLSINENNKNDLLNTLTNSKFYHDPIDYSTAINLINDIILSNNPLERLK